MFFIHSKTEGKKAQMVRVECKEKTLNWHRCAFIQSYGAKVPTRQMAKVSGRWRRVYRFALSGYGNIGNPFVLVTGRKVELHEVKFPE